MSLKIESDYTDKEGVVVQLKVPKMKVMGKLMEDGEKHELIVLSKEGVKTWEGNPVNVGGVMKVIPKHTLMVKFDGQEQGFSLELSEQAKKVVDNLSVLQFDKLLLEKGFFTNNQSGALIPIINASVERKSGVLASPSPASQQSNSPTLTVTGGVEAVTVNDEVLIPTKTVIPQLKPAPVIPVLEEEVIGVEDIPVETELEQPVVSGEYEEHKFMFTVKVYPSGKCFVDKPFPVGQTRRAMSGKRKSAKSVGEVVLDEEEVY